MARSSIARTYCNDFAPCLSWQLAAFAWNEQIIHQHNKRNLSYTLGHNSFSDMTWDEFKKDVMSVMFPKRAKNTTRVHIIKNGNPLAESIDWVAKGAVPPVKNQQR